MIFVTILSIEIQNLLSCDNERSWNSHVELPIFEYFDFYKSQLAVIHPVRNKKLERIFRQNYCFSIFCIAFWVPI